MIDSHQCSGMQHLKADRNTQQKLTWIVVLKSFPLCEVRIRRLIKKRAFADKIIDRKIATCLDDLDSYVPWKKSVWLKFMLT